jgi:hypothetical protein
MKNITLLLLLALAAAGSLCAQRIVTYRDLDGLMRSYDADAAAKAKYTDVIMYHDGDGNDKVLSNVYTELMMNGETPIGVTLFADGTYHIAADQIKAVTQNNGKRTYLSKPMTQPDGSVQHVLMRLLFASDDDRVYIVRYTAPDGARQELFWMSDAPETLYPLADENDSRALNSRLQAYLNEFPIASRPQVARYFDHAPAKLSAFSNRYTIAASGNVNRPPKFRWGFTAAIAQNAIDGIGSKVPDPITTQYTRHGYDFPTTLSPMFGVFADLAFGKRGWSVHGELTYATATFNDTKTVMNAFTKIDHYADLSIKQNQLLLPILMRYSWVNVKEKLIPYVQAGIGVNYYFVNEANAHFAPVVPDDVSVERTAEHALPSGTFSVIGGVGIEWKQSMAHSFFLDVRYVKNVGAIVGSITQHALQLSLSYSL